MVDTGGAQGGVATLDLHVIDFAVGIVVQHEPGVSTGCPVTDARGVDQRDRILVSQLRQSPGGCEAAHPCSDNAQSQAMLPTTGRAAGGGVGSVWYQPFGSDTDGRVRVFQCPWPNITDQLSDGRPCPVTGASGNSESSGPPGNVVLPGRTGIRHDNRNMPQVPAR